MPFKKELSKECRKCGVVFDETLSNKRKGRAMCIPCYKIEVKRISKVQVDARAVVGATLKRIALYRDYKLVNRKEYWREINKQIKPLTDMVEIREFISKQMDRILGDDNLMQYINAISVAEQRKNQQENKL